ncbi:MAG: endolytic transglycosylase MltG [Ectothiorhodospiraceae bacterium]
MKSRILQVLAGVALLGLVAAGLALADFYQWQSSPLHQRDEAPVVTLEQGDTVRSLTRALAERDLLERALYFRIEARLSGRAGQLQTGEYRIPAGTTPRELLARVARGDVVQHRFTIIEGWTFQQVRAALQADDRIRNTVQDADALMATLGRAGEHPEGWFYPETYRFTRGTSDRAILERAHQAMRERLQQVWEERPDDDDLPLDSPYEALILASLIERETGQADERRRIAGVFVRRLKRGMRLQTDPTVIYGMGDDYDGRIRTRDLRRDTPYNTYTRSGLPPTPIAMPGGASLEAAVNPASGSALYFVSRGDGSHVFSDTLEEHNRAVRRFILGEDE